MYWRQGPGRELAARCPERPGPCPQEADPPGGAVRAGDAAAAAARRGLRALRDPFLQEVQEPAQPAELRGALPSGAPGSAGGAGFWRRGGCRGPLSAPQSPVSVALHPRLTPNSPPPSPPPPTRSALRYVPESRLPGAPHSEQPSRPTADDRPHLSSMRSPTSPGAPFLQQRLPRAPAPGSARSAHRPPDSRPLVQPHAHLWGISRPSGPVSRGVA